MICPNCGAPLPNTAKMCYVCKTTFQSEGKTGELKGPAPIPPYVGQQQFNRPIAMTNNRRRKNNAVGIRLTAMITGLVGSALCGIALFMPYFTASAWGFSSSVTLYEDFSFDWKIFAFLTLLSMLASILAFKFGFGISLDLLGLAIGIVNFVEMSENMKSIAEKSEYSNLVSRGSGFYCMMAGAAIIIIAGVIAGVASAKEK